MTAHVLPNDPPMLKAAFRDLGLSETPGPRSSQRIIAGYRAAGHPTPEKLDDSKWAWCSAQMNLWAVESGMTGTRSLMARSWARWGNAIDFKRKKIPRGAVVVTARGNSSVFGHVCLALEDDGHGAVTVIGANQSDRNGGGVTVTRIRRSSIIAARVPLTVKNSNIVRLFGGTAASNGGAAAAAETASYLESGAQSTVEADGFEHALTQAQEVAAQAAGYLRWAQYALVAIGILLAGYGIYRYARAWLWPQADEVEAIMPWADEAEALPTAEPQPRRRKPTPRRAKPKPRKRKAA